MVIFQGTEIPPSSKLERPLSSIHLSRFDYHYSSSEVQNRGRGAVSEWIYPSSYLSQSPQIPLLYQDDMRLLAMLGAPLLSDILEDQG